MDNLPIPSSESANVLEAAAPNTAKKSRTWLKILVAMAVFLAVFGGIVAVAAGAVLSSGAASRAALEQASLAALDLDFEAAEDHLRLASLHFDKAERGFLILNAFSFVPYVGAQIEAADALARSGRETIDVLIEIAILGGELMRLSGLSHYDLEQMWSGFEPSMTFDDLPAETKRAILLRLASSAGELELLQHKISIVESELSRLPRRDLAEPILAAMEPAAALLGEFKEGLHLAAIAAHLLPAMAGLNQETAHLLLFLNNGELRPGGGFIGTYGILKVRDADIVSLETKDVYNLDNPAAPYIDRPAPKPLRRYNAADKWFFRDANWSPDFAAASRQTLELYYAQVSALPLEIRDQIEKPVIFQHVVGFTPTFSSDLLSLTGPISVSGQTFTAENVFDLLEYQVEFGYALQGVPEAQRKEILADLVSEMKTRLLAMPLSSWPQIMQAVRQALINKQLVIYSEDQALLDLLTRVGFAGRVLPSGHDFQMIVDANLASLKSDPSVAREITYEIFKNSQGEYLGRTSIVYRHQGRFDFKTTRYRTYTRLYLPLGSQWIKTSGALLDDSRHNPQGLPGEVEVDEDLGFTTFGTFTAIEPGQSRELVFEYKLADSVVLAIEAGRYQLNFQKQIGAANYPLTLKLDFDNKIKSAAPSEPAERFGDDVYHLNTILDQDLIFQVSL